mgnify:FL=1
MKRAILLLVAILALAVAAGCVSVVSAQGGNTAQTNEAWFTEATTLGPRGLPLSTRVYYCAPASGGAATCMEAEMIENASAGAPEGGAPPAAEPEVAPEPEAEAEGEGEGEGEME